MVAEYLKAVGSAVECVFVPLAPTQPSVYEAALRMILELFAHLGSRALVPLLLPLLEAGWTHSTRFSPLFERAYANFSREPEIVAVFAEHLPALVTVAPMQPTPELGTPLYDAVPSPRWDSSISQTGSSITDYGDDNVTPTFSAEPETSNDTIYPGDETPHSPTYGGDMSVDDGGAWT